MLKIVGRRKYIIGYIERERDKIVYIIYNTLHESYRFHKKSNIINIAFIKMCLQSQDSFKK